MPFLIILAGIGIFLFLTRNLSDDERDTYAGNTMLVIIILTMIYKFLTMG